MPTPVSSTPVIAAAEDRLLTELRQAARAREAAVIRLSEALDGGIFGALDQRIAAQVAAQAADLARQRAEAIGENLVEPIAPALVAHLHARAIEFAQLERMAEMLSIDAVLPPLVQAADPSTTADLLTAQARFLQDQRRGELEWAELPEELRGASGNAPPSRAALLARFVAAGGAPAALLDPEQAGFSLFATALAAHRKLPRDTIVAATAEPGMARIALALVASGVNAGAVARRLLALAPEAGRIDPVPALTPAAAAELLVQAA